MTESQINYQVEIIRDFIKVPTFQNGGVRESGTSSFLFALSNEVKLPKAKHYSIPVDNLKDVESILNKLLIDDKNNISERIVFLKERDKPNLNSQIYLVITNEISL